MKSLRRLVAALLQQLLRLLLSLGWSCSMHDLLCSKQGWCCSSSLKCRLMQPPVHCRRTLDAQWAHSTRWRPYRRPWTTIGPCEYQAFHMHRAGKFPGQLQGNPQNVNLV